MKTTFIRILVIAMLAISESAVAATEDSKPADAANPCANAKQENSLEKTGGSRKEKKSKKNRNNGQKEEKNDQLLSIWG